MTEIHESRADYNKRELPYYLWRRLLWTFGNRSPIFAYLKVTERCNLDCYYCPWHAPANKLDEELPTRAWKDIISEVIAKGVRLLVFEGGEPTLRKDLPELIEHVHSFGASSILATNGMCNFWEFQPNAFTISIDGPEEIHDRVRGKGTFKKIVGNLKKRTSSRPLVTITVITEDNAHLLEPMMEEISPLVDGFGFTFVYPYVTKGVSPISAATIEQTTATLIRLKKKYPIINPLNTLTKKANLKACHDNITLAINHRGQITQSCFVEHVEKKNCEDCQLACYRLFSSLHEFNLDAWFTIYRLIVRTI